MRFEDFDWDGAPGPAILRLPAGKVRAGLVALPGASDGSARQPLFDHLGRCLSGQGIAVLSFERRAMGCGDTPVALQAEDAIGAMRALKSRWGLPVGLFGFSQGAWSAAIAAADEATDFLVVLGCSGVSPADQMRFHTDELLRRRGFTERDRDRCRQLRLQLEAHHRAQPHAESNERLAVALREAAQEGWFPYAHLPLRPPAASPGWPDMDFDPTSAFTRLRTPVLAMWGDDEECVPRDASRSAWNASGADVEMVDLSRCGHWPVIGSGALGYTPRSEDTFTPDLADVLVPWLTRVIREDRTPTRGPVAATQNG